MARKGKKTTKASKQKKLMVDGTMEEPVTVKPAQHMIYGTQRVPYMDPNPFDPSNDESQLQEFGIEENARAEPVRKPVLTLSQMDLL